jgi:hypothetical protein
MSLSMPHLPAAVATLTLQGAPPAATHAHQATHVSGEVIVLAAVGAVAVLASLAWALSRTLTFEPRWLTTLRHAGAEAGFRASATLAELGDWARLGR